MSLLAPEKQQTTSQWQAVCALEDLTEDCGVCALVNGEQVAIFRLRNGNVYAIGNHDPIGGANVLSRGLIAEIDGRYTVSSPLYRHHYCLTSGTCLQDESVTLPTYQAKVEAGQLFVAVA